jgi:hypothetical protein
VKQAFLALAASNIILMVATAVTGWMVVGVNWFVEHFALGLMTTLFLCLAHCAVLTYFMATSKMIRLAVEDAGLPMRLSGQAQDLKRRAIVVLMPAIAAALAASLAGGWATVNPAGATLHMLIALASAAIQIAAFWHEFNLIAANGRLMDAVFEQHQAAKSPSQGPPPPSGPRPSESGP